MIDTIRGFFRRTEPAPLGALKRSELIALIQVMTTELAYYDRALSREGRDYVSDLAVAAHLFDCPPRQTLAFLLRRERPRLEREREQLD